MNQTYKKLWVDKLRSGEYPQSKHHLKTSEGYCCLGVLCEVVNPGGFVLSQEDREDGVAEIYFYGEDDEYLPDTIQKKTGLTDGFIINKLINMNDTSGNSFGEIADYIEENL